MRPFPSIICNSHPRLLFTAILIFSCLAAPRPVTAQQQAVYLGRDDDGRQLFRIGPLTAALSPGDQLGSCVVSETGLDCSASAAAAPASKAAPADAACEARLKRQEEKFQDRYLQSLKEYTENLRRKNYELVEKSRQLQQLRIQIGKEKGTRSTVNGQQEGPPDPSNHSAPGARPD